MEVKGFGLFDEKQSTLIDCANSFVGEYEGLLHVETFDAFLSGSQIHKQEESVIPPQSVFLQTLFSSHYQEGSPDFVRSCCCSICVSEDLLSVMVKNREKEMSISSYIKDVLFKNFAVSIKLPNISSEPEIENWLQNKIHQLKQSHNLPNYLLIKNTIDLSNAETPTNSITNLTNTLAFLCKLIQNQGIVPIIEFTFSDEQIPNFLNMLQSLQKLFHELIFSLHRHDVLLEGLILSVSLPGTRFVLDSNAQWDSYDSTEKLLFLNHLAWLRTLPPAIPVILINEGSSSDKSPDFLQFCELLNELQRRKIEVPWRIQLSTGKNAYGFFFEELNRPDFNPKISWSAFNRRLKVLFDSHQGRFDYKKTREVMWKSLP